MSYYGEHRCLGIIKSTHKPCSNFAYFLSDNNLLCGVHSKKDINRQKLPKNPNKGLNLKKELEKRQFEIKKASEINSNDNKRGNVMVSKLKMMKKTEYIEGYLNIFPNYKHQNRKDGYGLYEIITQKFRTYSP